MIFLSIYNYNYSLLVTCWVRRALEGSIFSSLSLDEEPGAFQAVHFLKLGG